MDYLYYQQAFLAHHGIKGQKWGVRRFQNADGSLTSEGRTRYGVLTKTGIEHQRGKLKRRVARGDGNAYAKYANALSSSNAQASTYAEAYFKKAKSYKKDADKKNALGDEKKADKLARKSDTALQKAETYKHYANIGQRELNRVLKKADATGQPLLSKEIRTIARRGEHAVRDFVIMTAAIAVAPGPGWAVAAAANFKTVKTKSYYRQK